MESVRSIFERLQQLIEERQRMFRLLSEYEAGGIAPRDVPMDAHTYYGRIRKADAEIERYAGWPELERLAAEQAGRILRLEKQTPERRERLEHLLETERGRIKDTTNLPFSLTWRLAAETVAWREGISRNEPHTREREREIWRDTLSQRADEIAASWRAVDAGTDVEAGAALNYWRGRAEEFNATREAIVRQHPERVKDLPPALEIEEIRVRQRVLERERSEENPRCRPLNGVSDKCLT